MPPVHPRIGALDANLQTIPKTNDVSHYVKGDGYRGPLKQAAEVAKGTSNASYGESAHNVGGVFNGVPFWGAARDYYAILKVDKVWDGELFKAGSVSPDPADYAPMIEVATNHHGLYSLGKSRGWDYPHISVPNWKSFEPAEKVPSITGGSSLLLLGLGLYFYLRSRGVF